MTDKAIEAAAHEMDEALMSCLGFTHDDVVEWVTQAITAYEAARGDGWQPIELARKTLPDTNPRLVWCPDRENVYMVSWGAYSSWGAQARYGWILWGSSAPLEEKPTKFCLVPTPPQGGGS